MPRGLSHTSIYHRMPHQHLKVQTKIIFLWNLIEGGLLNSFLTDEN